MSELIPIVTTDEGVQAVMGRSLHAFLEVKTAYKDWFPRMVDYGFSAVQDYLLKNERVQDSLGREREALNHIVTLDMAKEISMIQRSEKGKQARQYFLECERRAKETVPRELTGRELMARALMEADSTIRELEAMSARQAAELEAAAPKVLFADAVSASKTSILVGDLAKILRGNGIQVGANRLFAWLRSHGFLVSRKGTDWNMPTQRAMELELFRVKETTVVHSDGHTSLSKTPKITGKGQEYFISRFLDGRFQIEEVA